FEHRLQEAFNFTRGETAILCVLLLRGPQTPGELRGRTERMFRFEELSDVQSTLQRLMEGDDPVVAALPRQPGTKEIRYAHLLAGSAEAARAETAPTGAEKETGEQWRKTRREEQIEGRRREVAGWNQKGAELRNRFE